MLQAAAQAAKERKDYVHRPLRHPDFVNCGQADAVDVIIPRDKRTYLIRPHKTDPCRLVLTLMVSSWFLWPLSICGLSSAWSTGVPCDMMWKAVTTCWFWQAHAPRHAAL